MKQVIQLILITLVGPDISARGSLCGRKPENPEETHVVGQVTPYLFTSDRGIEPRPPW